MSPHVAIGFVGRFKNGQVHGNFWAGMVNEGYLHGKADDHRKFDLCFPDRTEQVT